MVVACRIVASVVAYSPEMCPAMSAVVAYSPEMCPAMSAPVGQVMTGRSEVEMGSVRINFIHTQIAYVVDGINGTEEIFNTDEAYVFGL